MKENETGVMVDLETMGNKAGAPVLEIGACAFDLERGIFSNFAERVSLNSCMAAGLKPDADTILWWMRQGEEARMAIAGKAVEEKALGLREALERFALWYASEAGENPTVWGKGASFDPVLLRAAYDAAGLAHPWAYWQERCHRTMVEEFPEVPPPRFEGVRHCALSDARHQTEHLLRILRHRYARPVAATAPVQIIPFEGAGA